MRVLNYFILCLLCLGNPLVVFAQDPVSIHITENEGLPGQEFYGLVEDRKGFIWLAGDKGLSRFDGTTFKTLEHPEKRGLSFFEPVLDAQDRVWGINISGQLFYTEGEELILFADFKDDLKGSLAALAISSQYLTLSTQFVSIIIDLHAMRITKKDVRRPGQFAYGSVSNDTIYFVINNELKSVVNDALELDVRLKTNLYGSGSYANRIGRGKLVSLSDNRMILYHQNEFRKTKQFLITNKIAKPIAFPDELTGIRILRIKEIDKKLWVLTTDGAFLCSMQGDKILLEDHYLKGIFLTDVIKDRDTNLWFSTLEEGVYVLPNVHIKRLDFPDHFERPVHMIQGKNKELLIGFGNGDVIVYNRETREQSLIDLPGKRTISAMAYDPNKAKYLLFQDVKNYQVATDNTRDVKEDALQFVAIKNMQTIGDNQLMFVSSGQAAIVPYPNSNRQDPYFLKEKRGYTCMQNPITGAKYFALVDELIVIDTEGRESQITTEHAGQILAHTLAITADGHLWAATFTNGLFEIDGTRVISHITEEDGLLSNRTTTIAADGTDLWISTSSGIQYMAHTEAGTVAFKNLKKQDGIPSYDIHDIVVVEGAVYFGSSNGVFSVSKQQSFKEFRVPEVYFTQVSINKNELPIKEQYTIKESESATRISFNANGFRGLSSGNYRYKLDGFDKDWTAIRQGVNEVQFASLPRGKYTFLLGAPDENGTVHSPEKIELIVTQVFYKTWWFRLLVIGIMIGLIIYYFIRKNKKQEESRQKELAQVQLDKELILLKLENLQSQMNPHFIFNALNSIQEYIVDNEKDLASSYLVKFSRLIRMYLDQSRSNSISLEEEFAAMDLYLQLEKVRFEDKLHYTLKGSEDADAISLKVPPLFIQPYVENALKHGLLHRHDNRQLDVLFEYVPSTKMLQVTVADNGIGRVASQSMKNSRPFYQTHQSFATQANADRVELLNKSRTRTITVTTTDLYEKEVATGTRVFIEIPQ